jgi:IclR family acetate operon transcriptional repressor
MAETSGDYQSVERALRVLEELAGRGPRGVSELAASLGMDKSSVSRMMKTLSALGYAEVAGQKGRYELGPKILYLGRRYLNDSNLLGEARPVLADLAAAARATTLIATPVGGYIVVLHKVPSPERLRVDLVIGDVVASHASALGRVLLAPMSRKERSRYLRYPLARLTSATVTERHALDDLLADILRDGYAIEAGEEDVGVGSIAAPVRDEAGHWFAALCAIGPLHGSSFALDERHVAIVTGHALDLSARLGYRPEQDSAAKLVG